MPPKKRARASTAASAASTPLAESQPKTPIEPPPRPPSVDATDDDILNDPWTDEQETVLLSSVIKWKPTGPHKHFRMLSIFNALHLNYPSTTPIPATAQHTRPAGIWSKLRKLFDLDVLDEREHQHWLLTQPDPADTRRAADTSDRDDEDEDEDGDDGRAARLFEFQLPEDEFGQLMWERRLPDEGTDPARRSRGSSPVWAALMTKKGDPAPAWGAKMTPMPAGEEETEGAKPSLPVRGRGSTRGGRGGAKSTRARGGAKAMGTRAQSALSSSAADEEESGEDDAEEEESAAGSPAPRGRGRGGRRARASRRGARRR